MKSLRFWQALDDIPGLAAPRIEWQRRLADEYDRVQDYLRRTHEIPSTFIGADGYSLFTVVRHAPGECVAVPQEGGPAHAIQESDVEILQFHERGFAKAIAMVLGLAGRCERVGGGLHVWRLGSAITPGKPKRPVFLAFRVESADYRLLAMELARDHSEEIVIVTPTDRQIALDRIVFSSLDELVDIDEQGSVVALGDLASTGIRVAPGRRQLSHAPRRLLGDPRKLDLVIVGQERLFIRNGSELLDSAKSTDFTPTAWITLLELAHQHGELTAPRGSDGGRRRKAKELDREQLPLQASERRRIAADLRRTGQRQKKRAERLGTRLVDLFRFTKEPIETAGGVSCLLFRSVLLEDA